MGIEQIAKREEICRQNQDWTKKRYTDVEGLYLVPRKLELSYCRTCNDKESVNGEPYCLARKARK